MASGGKWHNYYTWQHLATGKASDIDKSSPQYLLGSNLRNQEFDRAPILKTFPIDMLCTSQVRSAASTIRVALFPSVLSVSLISVPPRSLQEVSIL
jgi:hypothetical protein